MLIVKTMDNMDLFGKTSDKTEKKISQIKKGYNNILNGELFFYPDFFNSRECNDFLDYLKNSIEWRQDKMKMYGKEVQFPRLTAWFGDKQKDYSFSGITLQPTEWTNELLEIKQRVEEYCEVIFNSVLLNRYRNGNDWISWHQDNEKELGNNPVIGSVNFGKSRRFQLRHKETKEQIEVLLTNGSLLIMGGETQHYWQHQVPKERKITEERINLTFRVIL